MSDTSDDIITRGELFQLANEIAGTTQREFYLEVGRLESELRKQISDLQKEIIELRMRLEQQNLTLHQHRCDLNEHWRKLRDLGAQHD